MNYSTEEIAKRLRACTQLPEYELWVALCEEFGGGLFFRQEVVDGFIVDIYCPSKGLIIEIDGDSHDLKFGQNSRRYHSFQSLGLRILRFSSIEVKTNLAGVMSKVVAQIIQLAA